MPDIPDAAALDDEASTSPRGATLWRRIADDIELDIRNGAFAPGAPLPTVMALASRFDVNRHTVRQALQSLQARGFVSVEQGRGTFVRSRIYDYRLGRRVRFRNSFTGEGSTSSLATLSMAIEPLSAKEALRLNLPAGAPAWTFRTARSIDGLPLATGIHRLAVDRFPDFDKVFTGGDGSVTTAFRHYGIIDYVRLSTRITATLPTEEEQDILAIGPHHPILLARGVDGLPSGDAFHSVATAFAGDRIEFVLEPEDAALA